MANETKYSNQIHPVIVKDAASENLMPGAVWLPHVMREVMPSNSQTLQIPKKGELQRQIVPEAAAYAYGAGSEYVETYTLLNAIKSMNIIKQTHESKKFQRGSLSTVLGEEQGKALQTGMEQDIAALVAGFSSAIQAVPSGAIQLDLFGAAYAVRTATKGNGTIGNIVFVGHPTTMFRLGVKELIAPAGSFPMPTVFGKSDSTQNVVLENAGAAQRNDGWRGRMAGIDLYETVNIDSDVNNFRNLVFDKTRAFVGFWDDSVEMETDLEAETVIKKLIAIHYSDFAIHFNEGGCRLLDPVIV